MYMSVVIGLSARCCGAAGTEAVSRTHDVKTEAEKSNILIRVEITEENSKLSFTITYLSVDTTMASFHFKATISTFPSGGKQKGQQRKEGVFGFQTGQKHGAARAQNHLCASPPLLSIMLSTGACIGKD